jgi:hypothetical protein
LLSLVWVWLTSEHCFILIVLRVYCCGSLRRLHNPLFRNGCLLGLRLILVALLLLEWWQPHWDLVSISKLSWIRVTNIIISQVFGVDQLPSFMSWLSFIIDAAIFIYDTWTDGVWSSIIVDPNSAQLRDGNKISMWLPSF